MPEFPYQQALLKDPLSQETRKERRSLLAVSALGLIIVKAGLVPTRIAALGIEFSQADRTTLLWSLALITIYFLVAFLFYALADYSSYRIDTYILELRYHQRRKELLEVINDGLRSENEELRITKEGLEQVLEEKGQLEREFDRVKQEFENSLKIFNQQLVTRPAEPLSNQVAEVVAKLEELMVEVEALDLRRSAILRTDEGRIPSEKRNLEHTAELHDTENLEKRVGVIAAFRLVFEFVVPLILGFYAVGSLFRGR